MYIKYGTLKSALVGNKHTNYKRSVLVIGTSSYANYK